MTSDQPGLENALNDTEVKRTTREKEGETEKEEKEKAPSNKKQATRDTKGDRLTALPVLLLRLADGRPTKAPAGDTGGERPVLIECGVENDGETRLEERVPVVAGVVGVIGGGGLAAAVGAGVGGVGGCGGEGPQPSRKTWRVATRASYASGVTSVASDLRSFSACSLWCTVTR